MIIEFSTSISIPQNSQYDKNRVLQLVLGQQFQPGSDLRHFCQPTSVAIKSDGDIIVADGYCNQRLVVFDPHGNPKYSVGDGKLFSNPIENNKPMEHYIKFQLLFLYECHIL